MDKIVYEIINDIKYVLIHILYLQNDTHQTCGDSTFVQPKLWACKRVAPLLQVPIEIYCQF